MKVRFLSLCGLMATVTVACGQPVGDRSTAVDTKAEVTETTIEAEAAPAAPFPVPPKRPDPFGPGYYPNPLETAGSA